MRSNSNYVAFFIGSLGGGGAERVILNLASEFARNNVKVDLVLTKFKGQLTSIVPANVNVIELKKCNWLSVCRYFFQLPISSWLDVFSLILVSRPKVFQRIPSLINYLRENNPCAMLSTLDSINVAALFAKNLTTVDTKFVIRQATMHSYHVKYTKIYFDHRLLPKLVRYWYPTADRIIAVTDRIGEDLVEFVGVDKRIIQTINNPVDINKIKKLINEPVGEIWENDFKTPTVLAAGRLDSTKDYPTLLEAVKQVSLTRDIRLIILGDGVERRNLELLVRELSMERYVKLPGFVDNPYKYMAKANVFVLCSRWEGMPNVLIEALVCACTIVSTDCPSGPREILNNGEFGALVPIGDKNALAHAIEHSLDNKKDAEKLIDRANEFSLPKIAENYASILL